MNVKDIMCKQVASCSVNSNLDEVAQLMWANDCGSIPIIDDLNQPVGMITDRDIAMGASISHRPLWEITSGEVNRDRPAISCVETDDVKSVLNVMEEAQVRRLPVVDESGKLTGIVSIGDLIRFSASQKGARLPCKDTMKTLKTVTGHH